MSHFLVLGAGKMGVVLAKDLIKSNSKKGINFFNFLGDEPKILISALFRWRKIIV